jgi:hypothetical protein
MITPQLTIEMMLLSIFLTLLFVGRASGQVINLATGEEETGTYLESGFVTLSPLDTITVTTTNTFTSPVVYLSTVFSANGYSIDVPIKARVNEIVDDGSWGISALTFRIQLVWPSNKTCVSEWYDASAVEGGTYTVGWYVGETGAYSVSGVQMEFLTTSANAVDFSAATWSYPYGTDCNYPSQSGDDDYSPGAIFTIQSDNNNGEFLNVRAAQWFKNSVTKCNYAWAGGRIRLYPHDSGGSSSLIDLTTIQEETVGIFLFDTRHPQSIDCLANSYLQIGQITDLHNSPQQLTQPYQTIDTSSVSFGVFGSVLTLSGAENIVVMSYAMSSIPTEIFSFMQVQHTTLGEEERINCRIERH